MVSDTEGLAVGNNGVLLHLNGGIWTSVSTGSLLDLYNLDFNPAGTAALLVGESGKNMLWNTSTATALQSVIAGYLELKLPNTSIGMNPSTGSMSVALVSLNGTTPVDTVPSNTNPAQLANFTSASERMNVRNPPDSVITGNTSADPRSFASIPPYFYDYPVLSEWGGNYIETHEDAGFTTLKASASTMYTGKPAYYTQSQRAWGIDLADGPYFWRVRPRYYVANVYYTGVWSQGSSYKRIGLVPTNLKTSVSFATPTFSWDRVEGAAVYLFTLSEYADFSSPLKNAIPTSENQYTPDITLKDGISYYWKVSIQRYQNINNLQYASETFTLTLPTPTGLQPPVLPPSYFPNAPALCWDPLILPDSTGQMTFAAWKYRVEINKVATFDAATKFDTIDTEQQCWTSIKNFPDGDYYWRVALIDGEGKQGPWSSTAQFTKQYPAPTLLSPTSGGSSATTPMFEWTPVDGAASYVLQVAYDDKFSNMAFGAVTTAHVNYMPLAKLKADTLYYWRVAIKDKAGYQGPFNDATILVGTSKYKVYIPLIKR